MLYAFGSNGSGQLGVGDTEDTSTPTPVLIEGNTPPWSVTQLSAGGNHTLLLCNDGKVRATGNNEDGRCGLKSFSKLTHPTEIPFPLDEKTGEAVEIKQVAATWASSALLTTQGRIYVCGTGNAGELGLGFGVVNCMTLTKLPLSIPEGTKVEFLASGMAHTIAILSNGDVYGWGNGRKGQLGEPAQGIWEPRKIEATELRMFDAKMAVCGKEFTVVVGEEGTSDIAVFGPDSNDRFGIQENVPTSVKGWKSVAASWGSAFIVKDTGDVLAWGRDDRGQLPPQGLPEIRDLAAGSEHCLALTKDGRVLAWGWGEHGNCGIPVDNDADVKGGRWNEIEVSGRAVRVFAGCATSFIQTEENG